ncbi:uncharacterized protein [Typha angustifolia]|uniref:uncharacterized protein n=1 Tax=Typha angustifolia TaxID=59011 RepID=UPI003C2F6910
MATNSLTLKLLIDYSSERVLFAEADKDVVDFLFSLLSIPLGSVVKLLSGESMSMVGCISNVRESVKKLGKTYLQPNKDVGSLLNPAMPTPSYSPHALLLSSTPKMHYYRCSRHGDHNCVTDVRGSLCPSCRGTMTTELQFVGPNSGKVEANTGGGGGGGGEGEGSGGFVKGAMTYTIMDDLSIMPMSTISSITAINSFNVKDLSSLKEKTVKLGLQEGLEILKGSLQSETVLTDVFVGKGRGVGDADRRSRYNLRLSSPTSF